MSQHLDARLGKQSDLLSDNSWADLLGSSSVPHWGMLLVQRTGTGLAVKWKILSKDYPLDSALD